jgi:hypothetical protein
VCFHGSVMSTATNRYRLDATPFRQRHQRDPERPKHPPVPHPDRAVWLHRAHHCGHRFPLGAPPPSPVSHPEASASPGGGWLSLPDLDFLVVASSSSRANSTSQAEAVAMVLCLQRGRAAVILPSRDFSSSRTLVPDTKFPILVTAPRAAGAEACATLSRGDQAAQFVLLARSHAREPRGINLLILQPIAGVIDDDLLAFVEKTVRQ